jgi:hypothetical protein
MMTTWHYGMYYAACKQFKVFYVIKEIISMTIFLYSRKKNPIILEAFGVKWSVGLLPRGF